MTKEAIAKDAGEFLRTIAEATAKHSQNWDNFQGIAESVVQQALEKLSND